MAVLDIPEKSTGDILEVEEINEITESPNTVYAEAISASHVFDRGNFIFDGASVINGRVVPIIKLNPDILAANRTRVDTVQFEGNGTSESPYKLKAEYTGGTQLPTPVLSLVVSGQNTINASWPAVTGAATYKLERALNSAFTTGLTVLYNGSNLSFSNTGLTQSTLYYYRLSASAPGKLTSSFSSANATTDGAGSTTPAAPTAVTNDTNNTQSFSHALGESEIVVSVNDAAYVALTAVPGWNTTSHVIDVGNLNLVAGYYKAKIKADAASNRNESPVVSSGPFTSTGAALLPGFTSLDLKMAGALIQYNPALLTNNGDGTWSVPGNQNIDVILPIVLEEGGMVAFRVNGVLGDSSMGLVAPKEQRQKCGFGEYHNIPYALEGNNEIEFVDPSVNPANVLESGNHYILEFVTVGGQMRVNPYKSVDGTNLIAMQPERQVLFVQFVGATKGYIAISISGGEDGSATILDSPQAKNFTVMA